MSSAAFNNGVDRNHLTFNVNCGRKCVLINPDTLARVGVFVILLFLFSYGAGFSFNIVNRVNAIFV